MNIFEILEHLGIKYTIEYKLTTYQVDFDIDGYKISATGRTSYEAAYNVLNKVFKFAFDRRLSDKQVKLMAVE